MVLIFPYSFIALLNLSGYERRESSYILIGHVCAVFNPGNLPV